MTKFKYILKSFLHNLKANILVILGVAVSTMVLTGSLIIGDSVRYSLMQTTFFRLGETTHLIAVTDRYFRQEMASELESGIPGAEAAPVLILEGMAVAEGGQQRVNRVQIIGVDGSFEKIAKTDIYNSLQSNEIIISENLGSRLGVGEGDFIMVRVKKASQIPMNAPFVSDDETSVTIRAEIKKVAGKEELGRFSLKTSQTAPYNIFLSIGRLNSLMDFRGKANHILVSGNPDMDDLKRSLKNCLTPADAGLSVNYTEATDEAEIVTERVFLEPEIAGTLEKLPGARPVITYFVNRIGFAGNIYQDSLNQEAVSVENIGESQGEYYGREIPYSFVASLSGDLLSEDEIILTEWAADDLNAKPGDSLALHYYEIGPLRQLTNRVSTFVLKEIVPMTKEWADSTLMPQIPGLADAGHCREWDAGVPIDLDAIRDKDEEYWNIWKGAPKAYISFEKAREIWENRFGVYTAIRYPAGIFEKEAFETAFKEEIIPADLGMVVEPIREEGLSAAQNGTDFSGLFLGLSFFILASSIILTALLFRLNLESRSEEAGILAAVGFRESQVRSLFLTEGFVISLAGGFAGLLLSVLYTSGVFNILNTLWYDIVRTNMLLIKISPVTLVFGLLISLAVSVGAIYITLFRFRRRQTAELQKREEVKMKSGMQNLLNLIMVFSILIPLVLLFNQLLKPGNLNTDMFFLSGGLLLAGLILAYRKFLYSIEANRSGKIRIEQISRLNLTRNKGRSMTVVTLFALGTFIVVSTGSYKLDLFANAKEKSSGTGGFLFFAETTMPVLYSLNDPVKRSEEGIYEDFKAVQFRRVEGDDASCLNLNRISRPAILGVDSEDLKGRFSFAVKLREPEFDDPWEALDMTIEDGVIPAIADQTVIQWGLGKKVGDELLYQNEMGDTLRLKLIAGTKPSVFQGFVIISNKHFMRNYPSSSGSHIFLIDGRSVKEEQIGEELSSVYRDYGWEMSSTAKRLVEFYSVTNTYLSIFLALGALGMILGTLGLAVILARTIIERRREIALMQAIGFSFQNLFKILVNEYFLLLSAGVITGFITAVVATMPAFLSTNSDASFGTVALVTGLILINGIIWIVALSWISLRKKTLVKGLRAE